MIIKVDLNCSLCAYEAKKSSDMIRHYYCHNRCSRCDVTLEDKESFVEHMSKVHNRKLKCDKCGKCFYYNSNYTYHIGRCNGEWKKPQNEFKVDDLTWQKIEELQ